ncbi:hypothetical protein [Luteolibacter sp. LG18]|uniref:hypothetical protein n=1 Tax=Luteolibacter sp. LG18 TaxID=2819286 RepID=UPI002B2ED94A|nr:hypothetical protein llg_36080 [Luteolibacter sp. LG18]
MWEWLKSIAFSTVKTAWMFVPVAGIMMFFKWLIQEWAPARGEQAMQWLQGMVGHETIDFASVGLDWSRINQWVPASEGLQYAAKYGLVWAGMMLFRWVKKSLIASI